MILLLSSLRSICFVTISSVLFSYSSFGLIDIIPLYDVDKAIENMVMHYDILSHFLSKHQSYMHALGYDEEKNFKFSTNQKWAQPDMEW